jgi:Zn-dependent protease
VSLDGPPGPGSTSPRQHAWRTPAPGRAARPAGRPRSQRSLLWLIVIAAVVVILVRTHRLDSTDVILFCVLVPSVILHEVFHGVAALAFGDDTAKRAGRLSLNPLRHVTAFGTLIVPAITIWAGWGYFGWAKPVPVNVGRLRSPRNHGVLVALAGPLTNVALSALLGVIFYVAFVAGRVGPVPTTLATRIVFDAGVINLWVACFNMIPVPPLDGSALLERLLPAAWWPRYLRLRPYGMVLILGTLVLLSWARVYPLQAVIDHLATWWAHMVHLS